MLSLMLLINCSYFSTNSTDSEERLEDICTQATDSDHTLPNRCEKPCTNRECVAEKVPEEDRQYEEILVRKAIFWMGCDPTSQPDCDSDAAPLHQAELRSNFLMMKTEVTQGLYQYITGNKPSRFTDCGMDCPVDSVSWYDAIKFANLLSLKEGKAPCYHFIQDNSRWDASREHSRLWPFWDRKCLGWRLPTEAEWALAAMIPEALEGPPNTLLCAGGSCAEVAWIDSNSESMSHPACKKTPNARGFCDLSGNVWEWIWDYFGSYEEEMRIDYAGPETGMDNVVRGGSWDDSEKYSFISARDYGEQGLRYDNYGFRLVRTAEEE